MFNYNFSLLNLIKQNGNPHVIKGTVVLFVQCLFKPIEDMRSELLDFINSTRNKEKWTFQVMSLEQLLNDKYAIDYRTIRIETLNATTVRPLSDRYSSSSYLNDRLNTVGGFYIVSKEDSVEAAKVSDNFVVYAGQDILDLYEEDIRADIDYYKFEGLRFQIRADDDVINQLSEVDEF